MSTKNIPVALQRVELGDSLSDAIKRELKKSRAWARVEAFGCHVLQHRSQLQRVAIEIAENFGSLQQLHPRVKC